MTLHIGEVAPNFSARSTHGAFRFYAWMDGNWVVLLAYPRTITPASAREVRTVERLQPAFEKRRCKVMGLAVEPVDDLDDWLAHIATASGQAPSYPLIGSDDLHVARLFNLIRDEDVETQTMRRMIVIGPDRRVKLSVAYPMMTDAIFDEILQMIEALQVTTCGPDTLDTSPTRQA
jgi:alkyl hydroperoxide reductase subunit AhpC